MVQHTSARWFFAALIAVVIFLNHVWVWSLFHLIYIMLILRILDKDYQSSWLKPWYLLRWLLIPILVLHILFTPGEIIFVGYALPISYEGLQRGLGLALHLSEIFFAAILLARLLPLLIWIKAISYIPKLHQRLLPYLCLMPRIIVGVRVLVRKTYKQWRLEPLKFQMLPLYISRLVEGVENYSNRRAKYVWQGWDKSVLSVNEASNIYANPHQSKQETLMNGALIYGFMLPMLIEIGVRYL